MFYNDLKLSKKIEFSIKYRQKTQRAATPDVCWNDRLRLLERWPTFAGA